MSTVSRTVFPEDRDGEESQDSSDEGCALGGHKGLEGENE